MTGRTDLPPPPVDPPTSILGDYCLAPGDRVEVELLVPGGVGAVPSGPRVVEGLVAGATPAMLLIGTRTTDVRVPWSAIATIRNTVTPHPAL